MSYAFQLPSIRELNIHVKVYMGAVKVREEGKASQGRKVESMESITCSKFNYS